MAEHTTNKGELYEKYVRVLSQKKLPENVTKQQDIHLSELGYIVNHITDFITAFPDTAGKTHIIPKLCELIVQFGLVQKLEATEDIDIAESDFPHVPEYGIKCFEYLSVLLTQLGNLDTSGKCHFIKIALLLCATHYKKLFWSSEQSVAACKDFLHELLIYTDHKDVKSLLCDENFQPTIFKEILKVMRPSLLKDTWTKNPSSCYMFHWLLCNVKHPYLADYISDIFPPPFMFVNYHAIPQQVLGIQCFDHILDNVPPTLVTLNGREDAIYHNLSPLLYSKELPIITALYPCLLKLPTMRSKKVSRICWGQYDHVVDELLRSAEMECHPQRKRLFLLHIRTYIVHVPPFKHLKRLLQIVEKSLATSDGPDELCRIFSLKIMDTVIKLCWPRMENYCFQVLKMILKLMYDLEELEVIKNPHAAAEIYTLSEKCLNLLKHACHDKFQALVSDYVEDESGLPGVKLLKAVMLSED